MPLTIVVPAKEFYDEKNERFIEIKPTELVLEHSLLSLAKWEAKWHKAYLSREKKSREEVIDYIRCMTISKSVDPSVYLGLTSQNIKDITNYINDPMTATTFKKMDQKSSNEIVTNELIYFWMTVYSIPFSCEKWHLNHLMTLIEVANRKNQPSKKMSQSAVMRQNHSLNAARRAKYGTRG